jgi:H+/Cl- antiporter ClcA
LTLVGKMIAFTMSQEAGFLGGPVFPILFIGGTAGLLIHALIPDVPAPLAVAAMTAAVPGATIGAPVSFILIGVGVVGVGVTGIAPVGIAVVSAHLAVWGLKLLKETRESV